MTKPQVDRARGATTCALDPRSGSQPLERRESVGAEGVVVDIHVGPGFGELEREHGGVEQNSGFGHALPRRAPVFGGGVAVAGASSQVRSEPPSLASHVRRGLWRHWPVKRIERDSQRPIIIASDQEIDRARPSARSGSSSPNKTPCGLSGCSHSGQ